MSMDCFRHLNRIEFVVTMACTGRCKHCSEGEHLYRGGHMDGALGAEMVRQVCDVYPIDSLMTFGGEPLLFPEDVFRIHRAARDCGIPQRHVITNGYFAKDAERIREVAQGLAAAGVNKILLSVDAFHQETIPLSPVMLFAEAVLETGILCKTQPAWLVSETDDNPYNRQTREILSSFAQMGLESASGNVIFPAGNALRYLGEYFDPGKTYVNPYAEDPEDVQTLSVSADGSILGGNLHEMGILTLMQAYQKRYDENDKECVHT